MPLYRRRKMRPGPVQAIRMPVEDGVGFGWAPYKFCHSLCGTEEVLSLWPGQWLVIEGDIFVAMNDQEFCDVFEEIDP